MDSLTTHNVRQCGDEGPAAGRGPGQRGWYEWLTPFVRGASVLDVGCGLGYGLDILATSAREVRGQDVDPQLSDPRIEIKPLEQFRSNDVDVVVAVDVIEHIDDDGGFVRELVRIARRSVILTTPNWTAGRGTWEYHVREYTPAQLRTLCDRLGRCRMWKGTPDGYRTFPIVHPVANDWFNRLRVAPVVSHVARVANNVLPEAGRIHSHLAIVIDKP